jgi:hypothetical protein
VVAEHREQRPADLELRAALVELGLQEVLRFLDDVLEFERPHADLLAAEPAVVEQVPDERDHAPGRGDDALEVLALRLAELRAGLLEQEVAEAVDRAQRARRSWDTERT